MRQKEYRGGMTHHRQCVNIFLLLLLMFLQTTRIHTRPLHNKSPDDLIDGHDFLKLFLDRDDVQQEFSSNEYQGRGDSSPSSTFTQPHPSAIDELASGPVHDAPSTGRSIRSRTADYGNERAQPHGKQVAKLVTTGSKIVFPDDDLDDESLVNDVIVRGIDLQKDFTHANGKSTGAKQTDGQQLGDGIKVVAVSVSSSSHRGGRRQSIQFGSKNLHADNGKKGAASTPPTNTATTPKSMPTKTTTTTTTTRTPPPATTDFINRSHKNEFAIDEIEPMTMTKRKGRVSTATSSKFNVLNEPDSEHSASTNVRNVLDAPLAVRNSSMAIGRHFPAMSELTAAGTTTMDDDKFIQTVIYHDTKEGPHGPQSRSISYSSIAQNVEDFSKQWQRSGSLVEAQRNVNESLSPHLSIPRPPTDSSEPSKFYSVPSKMYGVPSKFYSEPSKVYSEPSKVYSQPSRVYGEPARTYWPLSTSTTTTTTTTTSPPTTMASKAPAATQALTYHKYSSRRPAIVSRIAFGEAQTTSTSTSTTTTTTSSPIRTNLYGHKQHEQHSSKSSADQKQQHHQYQNQNHNHQRTLPSSHRNSQTANTQPRRILFNLDKLPYDLLNAPEPSSSISTYLLDPALSESPPAAVTYSSPRERTCLEAAFAASAQQHSSEQQPHSNHQQNAKGLPNEDLVKCVSKFAASSSATVTTDPSNNGVSSQHRHHHQHQQQPHRLHLPLATESSHLAELQTPTPEQNYEIEESVSVMTNGRAHALSGSVGGVGIGSIAMTTTSAPPPSATKTTRSRLRYNNINIRAGLGTSHYNHHALANANDYTKDVTDGDDLPIYNYNEQQQPQQHTQQYQQHQQQQQQHLQHQNRHHHPSKSQSGGADDHGDGDDDDDSKSYYVEEGSNYRKYRVEEKTDDGFIVGEYGVVDHNDGNLRGVRYTADSTINPSLIQKALLTFLKLK